MKQTAVEWLVEQFNLQAYIPHIQQAKEMEKEQIIKAMSVAFIDGANIGAVNYESPYEDWEQYYNETYGK